MAKRNELLGATRSDTVIGSSVKLRGNLHSEGDISVDGVMVGAIKSGGHVTLGVNAQVTGGVSAMSLTVAGLLEGNVKVEDTVAIASSGQIYGDIHCTQLEVALGGILIGQSHMKRPAATEVDQRTEIEEARS